MTAPAAPSDTAMAETPADLVKYPTLWEYKVIGPAAPDFADFVRGRVEGALGRAVAPEEVEVIPSSKGKFQSIRVQVRLENEAQRQAIYAALSDKSRILFLL